MSCKLMLIMCVTSFLMVMVMPVRAYKQSVAFYPLEPFVLVQRNCAPGDLTINKESGEQAVVTNCIWQKQRVDSNGNKVLDKNGKTIEEDSDMQVTLHLAEDVDYVQGQCTYTPAVDSKDHIVDVATSKAGSITGLASPYPLPSTQYSISPNSTDIKLVFKLDKSKRENFDKVTKTYQANVIFDLNKRRADRLWFDIAFNAGNKIACTFQPSMQGDLPEDKANNKR